MSGMKLYPGPADTLSPYWIAKFEKDAARNWDQFYKRNGERFFKDRFSPQRSHSLHIFMRILLVCAACTIVS